ncbi:hypothetical protein Drose_37105 [Dactylosporangium roseum]|uniref:Uncharacterized protein n=1 Tax=Dactylosporangium roseum TaxID=47989 RepID=A0ABY5Z687_9ACTN|nr:hypothetical protein [Dactylosporangium roseum]UWZ36568.1 hypothetical protein Drose_37105 [Dactylosporangium roseum]
MSELSSRPYPPRPPLDPPKPPEPSEPTDRADRSAPAKPIADAGTANSQHPVDKLAPPPTDAPRPSEAGTKPGDPNPSALTPPEPEPTTTEPTDTTAASIEPLEVAQGTENSTQPDGPDLLENLDPANENTTGPQPDAPEITERESKAETDGKADWGNPNTFDPNMLTGRTAAEIDAAIPSDWERVPSKSGGGITYRDPDNFGRQIRVMPGYSDRNRPDAMTHGPYVVVSQNGTKTKVPMAGNPALKEGY